MSSSSPTSTDAKAGSRFYTEPVNSFSQSTSSDQDDNAGDSCEGPSPPAAGFESFSSRESGSQLTGLSHPRRVMFLEGEMEKLLEFGQQGSQIISDELKALLGRFESQKGALERLMKSEDQSPAASAASADFESDMASAPAGLSEESVRHYLMKLRRLMQEFSRAVCQSSLRPLATEAAAGAGRCRREGSGGKRRRIREAARPLRILDGVEALDIALVVNSDGRMHYRLDGGGLACVEASAHQQAGWSPLPRQTLYCAVSDSRRIAVVDTHGRLLTSFDIEDGQSEKSGNFERLSYMRASNGLLVSDYHSLYICDLSGRAEKSLHKFGWIVGHCVDETARRLYIADRVNEYVSVYCLDTLTERRGLVHNGFTDGLSSVCLLRRQLLVSDRGANRIFAFNSDSLEPMYSVPLRCPLFLTTDLERNIYVTVGGGHENAVKILDSRCRLQRKLVPGSKQFGSPGGLSVAIDASELFVCDLDNRRIQVFRL